MIQVNAVSLNSGNVIDPDLQSEKGFSATITKSSMVTTAFFFACMVNQAFVKPISMKTVRCNFEVTTGGGYYAYTRDNRPPCGKIFRLIPGCSWTDAGGGKHDLRLIIPSAATVKPHPAELDRNVKTSSSSNPPDRQIARI
jgi:hypothetical protein